MAHTSRMQRHRSGVWLRNRQAGREVRTYLAFGFGGMQEDGGRVVVVLAEGEGGGGALIWV